MQGESGVTLTLATLLGEAGIVKQVESKKPDFASPIAIKRNPFFSKFRPSQKKTKKEVFQLSGIISSGKIPTVVINDEVYKIGDIIGNKKVKRILSNTVILTDGKESTILTLEKE